MNTICCYFKRTIDLEYRKFYKLSIALFLLSVTFWALFALGLEFSRERVNPSSDTPYYFPNGVFGSMVGDISTYICLFVHNDYSVVWLLFNYVVVNDDNDGDVHDDDDDVNNHDDAIITLLLLFFFHRHS